MQSVYTDTQLDKKAIDLGVDFAVDALTAQSPMELGINAAFAINNAYQLYTQRQKTQEIQRSKGAVAQQLGYHKP